MLSIRVIQINLIERHAQFFVHVQITHRPLELSALVRRHRVGLRDERNDVYLVMKTLHELHVERLQTVTKQDLKPNWIELLLSSQSVIELLLYSVL